jgi:glycine cleavage system H protein
MKFQDYDVPDDLRYTKEHEWLKAKGQDAAVGITDYAAKTLNDVVYVTLPKVGEKVTQFKSMGTVESIKAVSELYSPVSGTVTKLNEKLASQPELVNKSPYADGWLLEIRPSNLAADSKNLLDAKAYSAHLGTLIEKT